VVWGAMGAEPQPNKVELRFAPAVGKSLAGMVFATSGVLP
jgi:hypothetical protein